MPTLKRVVASNGERDGNISLYGPLQHLQKATGAGRCAAGSNALLCASHEAHTTVAYSGPSTIALARA